MWRDRQKYRVQATVAEQILHKLAKAETRPEGRPQTGTGKPEKIEAKSQGAPETTKQDRKTNTGDTDEVLSDGTEHTHSESTHPGTKGNILPDRTLSQ